MSVNAENLPQPNAEFRKAVFVDSIYGSNQSAAVFQVFDANEQLVRGEGRLPIPRSTGDQEQDKTLWEQIKQGVQTWEQTGEFPENIQHLVC